jgi:adenylate cyclase class 2
MPIEIEAKLKVKSLAKIESKLKNCGAEFIGKFVQSDMYFDDAKGIIRKADSALRIRRQLAGRKEQITLAFKGPRQKGRFKHRREIQFEAGSVESAEKLLAELGYKKAIVIEKKRREWRLGGCIVALDKLPILGSFVEIEGPSEKKIASVQKKLGLADLVHIPKSYANLMRRKLRKV